jgi:acetylglutamate kinase
LSLNNDQLSHLNGTQALLDASKEVGLEVNLEKAKCMLMSHRKKAGQKHSIKIANRSFEDVAKFKNLITLTDQNSMQKEIKSRLNWGMLATIWSRVFCLPTCSLGI